MFKEGGVSTWISTRISAYLHVKAGDNKVNNVVPTSEGVPGRVGALACKTVLKGNSD